MQYCSNTYVCVHHEKNISKSLVIDICINNAIFSASLKDNKDGDNLICVLGIPRGNTYPCDIKFLLLCSCEVNMEI